MRLSVWCNKAGKYISQELRVHRVDLWSTSDLTILTNPSGADVYFREYSDLEGEWKKLGKTPIEI